MKNFVLVIYFLSIQLRCISCKLLSPTLLVDESPGFFHRASGPSLDSNVIVRDQTSALDVAVLRDQRRRRQDSVEKLDSDSCILTTSMKTVRQRSNALAKGIMFVLESAVDVELLSLEFAVGDDAPQSIPIQVYYREGSFSGVNGIPQSWNQLADTRAQISPDSKTAIVPAADFDGFEMKANTEHALYVSLTASDVLQVYQTGATIGEKSETDGILQKRTGVLLEEGPFPQTLGLGLAAEFEGILHYSISQSCTNTVTTTDVKVAFAINGDPTQNRMSELSESVDQVISSIITLDPVLGSFMTVHLLAVREVRADFTGRSEEKCPPEFEKCSLVTTTITLEHLHSVGAGELRRLVLGKTGDLETSVKSRISEFPLAYVGLPIVDSMFEILLFGLSQPMVAIQRRYFERVSSDFVAEFVTDVPAYEVVVAEDDAPADNGEDIPVDGNSRRLSHHSLRGSSRQIQAAVQVIITVYGGGNEEDFKKAVIDAFDSSKERYLNELKLQQLRPGEINEDGLGSIFYDISDLRFRSWSKPSNTTINTVETDDDISPVWMPLSIVGIVLSTLFLIYRFFKDCDSDTRTMMEKQLEEGVVAASEHDNTEDIEQAPQRQKSYEEIPSIPSRGRSVDRLPPMRNLSFGASLRSDDQNRRGLLARSNSMRERPRSADRLLVRLNSNRSLVRDSTIGPSASIVGSNASVGGPVNMAGRNGRGVAPSRSMPMKRGSRPPSLDRLVESDRRASNALSSNASVPADNGSSNSAARRGQRPPSLDRLLKDQNPIPKRSMSSNASLPAKPASPESQFSKNDLVVYKGADGEENAKILDTHLDDDLEPFYTIKLLESGKEKQTDDAHLKPLANKLSKYDENQLIFFKGTEKLELAQVMQVHYDGNLSPRYTVRIQESKETKDVEEANLIGLGEASSANLDKRRPPPNQGVKKARSMEGLPLRRKPSSMKVSSVPESSESYQTSGSGTSPSHQQDRGVKKARSMEGLQAMRKPSSMKGSSAHRKEFLQDSNHTSDSSSSRQPDRGVKKARSMEGLQAMRKPASMKGSSRAHRKEFLHQDSNHTSNSSSSRQPNRGVKKARSMEGMLAMKSASPKANFSKEEIVVYKGANGQEKAKILDVHLDDDLVPFYTVKLLESGKEKQTDDAHLTPIQKQPNMKGLGLQQQDLSRRGVGLIGSSNHTTDSAASSSSRQPERGVRKARSMEGLQGMKKPPGQGSAAYRRALSRRALGTSDSNHTAGGGSSLSKGHLPSRGVKKASSMEGLTSMKRQNSFKGSSAHREQLRLQSLEQAGSTHHRSSDSCTSSNQKEPTRGVKKARSMEGLTTVKQQLQPVESSLTPERESSPSRQPNRGVKKTRSMEGLTSQKKKTTLNSSSAHPPRKPQRQLSMERKPLDSKKQLSPLGTPSQHSNSRGGGKYDWSKKKRYWDSDSDSESEDEDSSFFKGAKNSTGKAQKSNEDKNNNTQSNTKRPVPTRGLKKTLSMDALYKMKKHGSSMISASSSHDTSQTAKREPQRGVKKTRSMEGLPNRKQNELSPMTASNQNPTGGGGYDWSKKKRYWDVDDSSSEESESESESESDYSSESSIEPDWEHEDVEQEKSSAINNNNKAQAGAGAAGQKILRVDHDHSSSDESDYYDPVSQKALHGEYDAALRRLERKKKRDSLEKAETSGESDSGDSIPLPSLEKKKKKKDRKDKKKKKKKKNSKKISKKEDKTTVGSSDSSEIKESSSSRGRDLKRIPSNRNSTRSISMDGNVKNLRKKE